MEMESTSAASLQCVVVTPEKAILDEKVEFIALPMYDGEVGVLPGRAPLIGRLGFGELRLQHGGNTRRFYIDGGFVQVRHDVVTVLTSKAIAAENIKVEAAQTTLREAQQIATTEDAQKSQQQAQDRARAQLRVAGHLNAGEANAAAHVG